MRPAMQASCQHARGLLDVAQAQCMCRDAFHEGRLEVACAQKLVHFGEDRLCNVPVYVLCSSSNDIVINIEQQNTQAPQLQVWY